MKATDELGITDWLKLAVAAICLVPLLGNIANSTQWIFNDGRLAPAFSILAGNPPYCPLNGGPILNTAYGPLSYFYYFPCALFRHNISLAIISGSFLSFLAFAIPCLVVLYRQRNSLGLVQLVWLMALGVLQIMAYSSFTYSAFNIHADAPAVLFSSLCVLLLAGKEGQPVPARALFWSTAFGVVTIWTKQTYAAVILLPLVVAFVEKQTWRLRMALVGWVIFLNGLFFIIFALWCGKEALLYNFLKVPASIPWAPVGFLYGVDPHETSHLRSVVVAAHIIVGKYLAPYLLCLAAFILFSLKNGSPAGNNFSFL